MLFLTTAFTFPHFLPEYCNVISFQPVDFFIVLFNFTLMFQSIFTVFSLELLTFKQLRNFVFINFYSLAEKKIFDYQPTDSSSVNYYLFPYRVGLFLFVNISNYQTNLNIENNPRKYRNPSSYYNSFTQRKKAIKTTTLYNRNCPLNVYHVEN